jgi:hypothetical protein
MIAGCPLRPRSARLAAQNSQLSAPEAAVGTTEFAMQIGGSAS